MEHINVSIGIDAHHIDGKVVFSASCTSSWDYIWRLLIDMAYSSKNIHLKSIIIQNGSFVEHFDTSVTVREKEASSVHAKFYDKADSTNVDLLTLEHAWRKYGGHEMPKVVPELERLFVPRSLFYCLGVNSWFRHSFPNCRIAYWEDY